MIVPDKFKINKDIEIYENEVEIYIQDYIDTLMDPNDIKQSSTFTGLIAYLQQKCKFNHDIKIYNDTDYLWSIWIIYRNLVYKYNQLPMIEEFCILLNINKDTFYSWANGEKRGSDFSEKLSASRADICQKIKQECANGRLKLAAKGNVGGIFLCKAVDHLVETAPAPVQEINKLEMEKLQDSLKAFESFQIGVKN